MHRKSSACLPAEEVQSSEPHPACNRLCGPSTPTLVPQTLLGAPLLRLLFLLLSLSQPHLFAPRAHSSAQAAFGPPSETRSPWDSPVTALTPFFLFPFRTVPRGRLAFPFCFFFFFFFLSAGQRIWLFLFTSISGDRPNSSSSKGAKWWLRMAWASVISLSLPKPLHLHVQLSTKSEFALQ